MLKYFLAILIFLAIIVVICIKNKISKRLYFIIKIALIVVLLEATIFNINSYRTDFGKLEYQSFVSSELSEHIQINQDGSQYVYFSDLNSKVKTVYIELSGLDENEVVDYDIIYSDNSTSDRYLATKTYCQEVEKTKYVNCSFSRKCQEFGDKRKK